MFLLLSLFYQTAQQWSFAEKLKIMQKVTQSTSTVPNKTYNIKRVETCIDGKVQSSNTVFASQVQNELNDQFHLAQAEVRANEIENSRNAGW